MTTWLVIPARGGSKGLPGKNLRTVGGASLVAKAVHAARMCVARMDLAPCRIIVDTDDPAIADEARLWHAEVPFLRHQTLAEDTSSSVDTMLGLLARLGDAVSNPDLVVLLQPTSPLRSAASIRACIEAVCQGALSAATVARTPHPVDLALTQRVDQTMAWVQPDASDGRRRQALRTTMHLTGGVYATTVRHLKNTRRFVSPGETVGIEVGAGEAVDIDTIEQLDAADALLRARVAPRISIGRCAIGGSAPCLVIAEAGVNHNGDVTRAHALIDAAADAGADVVKFQTFDPEALATQDAPKARYQEEHDGAGTQLEMLRNLTLPTFAWANLALHAADRGLLFLSTPFDTASADLLAALGVAAYKVPSGELTNLALLADLAARGRPLLVSTGMATLAEVSDALVTIAAHGAPPVALFHCVSQYPSPLGESNLSAIRTLGASFGVPVGWSDHTSGTLASLVALGHGAAMIEKHLTLDCTLPGPDHAASLEPAALAALVRDVRAAESMRGDGVKRPAPSEWETMAVARRSLHAARDLAVGDVLEASDLLVLRPGTGLPPSARDRVIGRPLRQRVARGAALEESHVG